MDRLTQNRLHLKLPLLNDSTLFTKLFTRCQQHCPGVDVRLVRNNDHGVRRTILDNRLRLNKDLLAQSPRFRYRPFYSRPLSTLLPTTRPLTTGSIVNLRRLTSAPFLLCRHDFILGSQLLRTYRRVNFAPGRNKHDNRTSFLTTLITTKRNIILLPQMITHKLMQPNIIHLALGTPTALH